MNDNLDNMYTNMNIRYYNDQAESSCLYSEVEVYPFFQPFEKDRLPFIISAKFDHHWLSKSIRKSKDRGQTVFTLSV